MTQAVTTRSGFGTAGYCKLCSITDPVLQDEYDKRTGTKANDKYVYSPAALNDWAEKKGIPGLKVNRQTVYQHRLHVMHPNDKVITAIEKREAEHGVQPQQASEDEFIDALILQGQRKIAADPNSVTISDALKAVGIKKGTGKGSNAVTVLVGLMTGGPQETTIVVEGEVEP